MAGRLSEQYKRYINPSISRAFNLMGCGVEARALGSTIIDGDGKQYLDAAGGFGVFSLGHSHPVVVSRVRDQLEKMPLSTRTMYNEPLAMLSELLATISPQGLQYSFICNSGAEAVEGALKMARASTGKRGIIAAENSFHGKTLGALSATGKEIYRKPFYPLLDSFTFVPYGDAAAVASAINDQTAAVIVEAIQGEGGIIVPPPSYLPALREICTRNGVLLIVDEVQTGLGRTGKMFGVDHFNVAPDIMTLGKALGGGVMPVAAFIGTPAVWQPLIENPFLHTSTFGGNPLACVAGQATIELLLSEPIIQEVEAKGRLILDRLSNMQAALPHIIEDVRGQGLMIGLELASAGLCGLIISEAMKQGVLLAFTLNNSKVIRIEPPLTTSMAEIEKILSAIEHGLERSDQITGKAKATY
jgi:putrescine aminotransferase